MQADPGRASEFLIRLIEPHVEAKGVEWLQDKQRQIADGAPDRSFFAAFSAAPRFLGKADLQLSESDRVEADEIRKGWRPSGWSVDQAGRTILVLALPSSDADEHVRQMDQLFSAADVGELIALYQMLPLFPHPERYVPRAAEGLRSSISSVFNAVALNNPFPADYFEELFWNQMVLKALFVGSPLYQIEGLDARANPELARMLVDYAHERWAASRPVSPELWRPVGPFADEAMVADLERVLKTDDPVQQQAAALALKQSKTPSAHEVLARYSRLEQSLQDGTLTWSTLTSRLN
jgi:hypothetical protein